MWSFQDAQCALALLSSFSRMNLAMFRRMSPLRLACLPLALASLGVVGLAGAGGAAYGNTDWPAAPSRLQLETPYGHLHVSQSDYVYESRLLLDDEPIQPVVEGLLNIPYAYSSSRYHVALVSIDSGHSSCPVAYQWITLSAKGYDITPPFGSCSSAIRVAAKGTRFTLETPSQDTPGRVDVYVYDGKSVKKKAGG